MFTDMSRSIKRKRVKQKQIININSAVSNPWLSFCSDFRMQIWANKSITKDSIYTERTSSNKRGAIKDLSNLVGSSNKSVSKSKSKSKSKVGFNSVFLLMKISQSLAIFEMIREIFTDFETTFYSTFWVWLWALWTEFKKISPSLVCWIWLLIEFLNL